MPLPSPSLIIRRLCRPALCALLALSLAPASNAIDLSPDAFPSNGTLREGSGTFTLDTTQLLAFGTFAPSRPGPPRLFAGSGVLQPQVGGPDIAVFTFDDIQLGGLVNIDIIGSRPVAILSKGNAIFRSLIALDASDAVGRAGGGNGGSAGVRSVLSQFSVSPGAGDGPGGGAPRTSGGDGGGFGGRGGMGALTLPAQRDPLDEPYGGGAAYGDTLGNLQGGSGGGGAALIPGFGSNAAGGAGGGGLFINAVGTTRVTTILAKGASTIEGGAGSGGMIALRGSRVEFATGARLDASGGNTELSTRLSSFGELGGGGGGGRILVAPREFAWGVDSIAELVASGGTVPLPSTGYLPAQAGAPGVIVVRADTLSVGAGQALALSNGPLILPGTSQTLDFDALRIDAGGLAFATAGHELTHTLRMNGGFLTAPNGLMAAPGVAVRGFGTIGGPVTVSEDSFLVAEQGTLSIGDPSAAQGLQIGGFVSVDTHSTLLLQSAHRIALGPNTKLFSNSRLVSINGIEVAAGTTLESFGPAIVDGTVHNAGRIEGPTGEDQALVFLDDGDGAGDFTGNIVFRGAFNPGNSPAVVQMENVTLDPTAALSIEIAGRAPGEFDQLLVSGTAALGGTLHVSFIDGFGAQAGDSFAFIVAGTLTGTFAHVDVAGLDPALRYAIAYGADGVRFDVQAVPEPRTWAMLGLGLTIVGVAGARRARAVA